MIKNLLRNLYYKSLSLIILMLLTSCVGTIQDASKKITDSTLVSKAALSFEGISKASATAHNRIRVSFKPAQGGSGNFSYLVYVNGNFAIPVSSMSNASVALDSEGFYNVDVKNLQINMSYTFSVRVYDVENDQSDSNTVSITARTLSDLVPIFDGATVLENLPGIDGLTQLKVSWNKAEAAVVDDSGFGNNTNNVSGYNIYAGESEASLSLVGSVGDANTKSFVVSNLVSGRNYFVRVRAKNSASPKVEDGNMVTLQRKTLVSQPISFSGLKTISIPKTVEGFSAINLTWDAGSGTFDRYKIMVFTTSPGTVNPVSSTPDSVLVVTDLSVISKTITVPSPNTTYYVAVIACAGDACTEYGGASVVKSIKTTPPVAPFNGISSISILDLHSIQINWNKPDSNQGVYSKVKLFKSDSSGNYNEMTDEITADSGLTGLTIDSSTDTSATLKNLSTDVEYCFVAMAYDDFYMTAEYPFGRASTFRVKSCATLHYTAPNFLGINTSCTSPTSSGFTVNWSAPVPMGIFDNYEIYIKEGNSGFSFTDAIAGNSAYTKISPISKDVTSFIFNSSTSYKPAADTYYQIGVKTYYNDSGTIRRDTNNSYTLNCKTSAATISHQGWYEVLSIGPKVDGLKAGQNLGVVTSNEVIKERLKPRGVMIDGLTEVRDLVYPQEWPTGSEGVDSSSQGIIRLVWRDFELSNGLGNLYDYANSHSSATVEYRVYRKMHASKYDTTYALKAKVGDTDWGAPINTTTIPPSSTTLPNGSTLKFAEFIDYTLTHPYSSDSSKINEGTIFYYKVEAYINGSKVNFDATYADAVIRVVLPPANMSFVHRWMANQTMCNEIGRQSDRENNYRCPYNGIASTYDSDSNAYYYDMKGDILVDRFKMGCNFTRGSDSVKKCTDSGYTVAASKIFFEGNITDSTKGRIAGDCIGYGNNGTSPNGLITAGRGAVFFDRAAHACYVNTSTTAGNTWQKLSQLDSVTVTKASSKILPNTLSSVGEGWGNLIYSNNAYLPILTTGHQNNLYRVCQSNTVAINGINFRKRLERRKELMATHSTSSFLPFATYQKIQIGVLQSSATIDRDCTSGGGSISQMVPSVASASGASEMDLTKWNYPNGFASSSSYHYTVKTGSAGQKSTEFCQSMFGLQDVSGNMSEMMSDRFYCNGSSSKDFCSLGLKDKNAINTSESSLVASQLYIPEFDPQNRNVTKLGNGKFLSMGSSSVANAPAVLYLAATQSLAFLTSYPATYNYYSPIYGIMLTCQGNGCLIDGTYDDNTLVTTKTSSSVASILSYPVIGNHGTSVGNTYTYLPIYNMSFSGDGGADGAKTFSMRFDSNNDSSGVGRCTTLIENYNDQSMQYND